MDTVLIDGDQALFQPAFGAATAVPRPGQLAASGPATVGGKPLAVDGDESSVSVAGCLYMTPQYSIPGTGTLVIAALAGDQKAGKTRTGGKAVLLVGSQFTAELRVESPAQQPPPGGGSPIPDATPQYRGQGRSLPTTVKPKST